MVLKKTSGEDAEPSKSMVIYTQNAIVCGKLQAAGYVVSGQKQMTVLGSKEYELKGKVPLGIEALNKAVEQGLKGHQKARELIKKNVFDEMDLGMVYEESAEPTKEVIEMKKSMAEESAARKAKAKGKKK